VWFWAVARTAPAAMDKYLTRPVEAASSKSKARRDLVSA
jgi:hypothetical protein